MSILWKPNGSLNISTDPANLPHTILSRTSVYSESMQRCKNLRLDRTGKASTRFGSQQLATNGQYDDFYLHLAFVQNGILHVFSGNSIYANGTVVNALMTDAQWFAVQYNVIDSTEFQIFTSNGTNQVRIEGSGGKANTFTWGLLDVEKIGLYASTFFQFSTTKLCTSGS